MMPRPSVLSLGLSLLAGSGLLSPASGEVDCAVPCYKYGADGCVELVSDHVYGCYGGFGSPIGDSALNDCNVAGGWHECESANEAAVLGLTSSDCDSKVPTGHSFWCLESSLHGDGECYSEHGTVGDDRPFNDYWGCVGSATSIPGCGAYENTPCGPLNIGCSCNTQAAFAGSGMDCCNGYCPDNELFTMGARDPEINGVLCCSNTIPDTSAESCDESITVYSLRKGFQVPTPNYAPFVGKYAYYGIDETSGYPRYVHAQSGAEITLGLWGRLVGSLVLTVILPNQGTWYAEANSVNDGVVTDIGSGRWEIRDTFFSPAGTDTSASTTNDDHINLLQYLGDDLQMTATFSDCEWYGLEKVSAPTPLPTMKPVTPVPTSAQGQVCDYDFTVPDPSSCAGDAHCADCQAWGCSACEDGYYKMGLFNTCQSCTAIFPNCADCDDWNGCVSCDWGYSLVWDPQCNANGDEVCA